MKWAGVWLHAALLVTALGFSWWSYTDNDTTEQSAETVLIWNLGDKPITSVKYKMKSKGVTLERRNQENGDTYLWAISTRQRPIQVPKKSAKKPTQPAKKTAEGPDSKPTQPDPAKAPSEKTPTKPASLTKDAGEKPTQPDPANATSEKTPTKPASLTKDAVKKPSKDKPQSAKSDSAPPDSAANSTPTQSKKNKDPIAPQKPTATSAKSNLPTVQKTETVTKAFRGNAKADELLAALRALKAKRSLGTMTDDQLDELKLKSPEASLVVTTGEATHRLDIGMAAYGGGLRYVRNPDNGTVFAMKANHVDNLRWADSRLVERELFGFIKEQIKGMTVTSATGKQAWDTLDEAAQTWLSKLFRLKVTRYVPQEENWREVDGKSIVPITVASVTLVPKDGTPETLTIARIGEGKGAKFFAQSSHTVAWVAVSNFTASELEKDLEGLITKTPGNQ